MASEVSILNDIKKYFEKERSTAEHLSEQQKARLFAKVKENDNEAIEKIMNAYLPLVLSESRQKANSISGDDQLFADLFQEGNLALFRAIKGCKNVESFSSYAKAAINNALNEFVRRNHLIPLPIEVYSLICKLKELKEEYYLKNSEYPDDAYLISKLEITSEKYQDILSYAYEAKTYDDQDDEGILNSFNYNQDFVQKALIKDIIESLEDERDKYIVVSYLGLDAKKMTFEEIANELNVSKQYISQHYKKVIRELSERYR